MKLQLALAVLALCALTVLAQNNPCPNAKLCNTRHQNALSWSIDNIPYSYQNGRRCPHKHGVFCADNQHCCPNAMTCSVNGQDTPKCMPDLSISPMQPTSIMLATPIISPPGVTKTSVEKCLDALSCRFQKYLP